MNLIVFEHSVFLIVFWLSFDKFHCVFYLYLKSNRYVCRRLIKWFVGDENYLHRVCVMVNYNKLILLEVGNKIHLFERLKEFC